VIGLPWPRRRIAYGRIAICHGTPNLSRTQNSIEIDTVGEKMRRRKSVKTPRAKLASKEENETYIQTPARIYRQYGPVNARPEIGPDSDVFQWHMKDDEGQREVVTMGCSQSKIENEEAVSRCKERKQLMKDAVAARNAFAAANSSYAVSLRNTGAALSDFASGESLFPHPHPHLSHSISAPSSSSPPPLPPEPSSYGTLPPPPPPIPPNMAVQPPTLQRAQSMPEMVVPKTVPNLSETIEEEEEDEEEVEGEVHNLRRNSRRRGPEVSALEEENRIRPPPTPPPQITTASNEAPPSPPHGNTHYDFFFGYDMPGGVLRTPEEVNKERDEIERKVFEETAKRADANASSFGSRIKDDLPPKVPEKPPVPPPQEAEVVESGKTMRRGKQVALDPGVGPGGVGEAKRVGKSLSLVQIFNDLDDYFLQASESAHEVSKMLEATRLHYHSSTANNCGHINHSERVMKVITWNRSFRGLQNTDDKDDFDSEENETHATVLDKLLAWEKKLYDEVKAGEIMKFDYQRKVALLNKQKKRGAKPETLEKTKASLSRLHTRYIVDMQSLDSTVSEINRLRDEQLYPKLSALVDGLATMWSVMQTYYSKQSKIASALKYCDISQCVKETNNQHFEQTEQLWIIVQRWHDQFDMMVSNQKRYIKDLNSWLKLNLIPIESSLKEKVSSPPRTQNPPIQRLLLAWHDCLEKLPEEHAKTAIYNFASVLHTIIIQQDDELKMRAKCEEARRDLDRKTRAFEDWCSKHMQRPTPPDEANLDMMPDDFAHDEAVFERENALEAAKKRLEEEEAAYQKQCMQVREKTLANLRARLPELFWALLDFAGACSQAYNELKSTYQSYSRRERSS
ncbi:hypothetical protein V2J09_022132, partial [Rumex salicifolius]